MIPHRQGEYIRYADHEQSVVKAREALTGLLLACPSGYCEAFPHEIKDLHRAVEDCPCVVRYNVAQEQAREALAALSPADSGK